MRNSEYLSHKENWTSLLVYVHRTRIILGFVLGTAFGASLSFWLF